MNSENINCRFKNEIINKIHNNELCYDDILKLIAEGYIDKIDDIEYYKECMAKRQENIQKIIRIFSELSIITVAEILESALDDSTLARIMNYAKKVYNVEV